MNAILFGLVPLALLLGAGAAIVWFFRQAVSAPSVLARVLYLASGVMLIIILWAVVTFVVGF
jgi:hypothetical protein